jgi:hypothetical protein
MIDLLLVAAYLTLLLFALRILELMLTGGVAWRDLLSQAKDGRPVASRSVFLFGHLGIALVFLLSVLKFDGCNIEVLADATKILSDFDFTAATGSVSAFYIWAKLKK